MIKQNVSELDSIDILNVVRGLGRIWATGCVKEKTGCVNFVLATLTIHSFTFLTNLQSKNNLLAQLINIGLNVAQMLKK